MFLYFYSNHLTSLSHRVSKLGAIEGNVKHRYKKVLEQTHADNIKVGPDKKKKVLEQTYADNIKVRPEENTKKFWNRPMLTILR